MPWDKDHQKEWRERNKLHLRNYDKARGKDNLEYDRSSAAAYSRKSSRNIRREIVDFLGGGCADCGITDIRVLQFHHANFDGKSKRSEMNGARSKKYCEAILAQHKDGTSPLVLLCANCHMIRHFINNAEDPTHVL